MSKRLRTIAQLLGRFDITRIMRTSIEIPSAALQQAALLTGRAGADAVEHLIWSHGQLVADLRAARRRLTDLDAERLELDGLVLQLQQIAAAIAEL